MFTPDLADGGPDIKQLTRLRTTHIIWSDPEYEGQIVHREDEAPARGAMRKYLREPTGAASRLEDAHLRVPTGMSEHLIDFIPFFLRVLLGGPYGVNLRVKVFGF